MCASAPPPITTTAQLRVAGRTPRWIRSAVSRGELEKLRRGVYAQNSACAAAKSAARHGGSLACVSAARHLGIWVLDDPVAPHVWLRGHGHRHGCEPPPDEEACACIEHWDDGPRADAFGLPPVPQILRQLLTCYGIETFFVAVESALNKRLLGAAGMRWLRRNTNSAAREALDLAGPQADSGLESLLRWRLRKVAVRIRSQVAIASVGVVDFLIGDRLIIEVDGKPNHEGATERHKDLVRDANAAAWGYITLRFDYAMVVYDWATVELAVLAHIDAGLHLH